MADQASIYDDDAEAAAIGAMINSEQGRIEVINMLDAEMFGNPALRIVFETIRSMVEQGKAVDAVTLVSEMRARKRVDEAGGLVAIASLTERCPAWSNARAYAETVIDRHTRRSLITAAFSIKDAVERAATAEEATALSQAAILAAAGDRQETSVPTDAASLAEWFSTDYYTADTARRIPYGFADLDRKTGGYGIGEMVVIGGFQKEGKSFLALQFLLHAARSGFRVGMFNLEMSKPALMRRLVTMLGGVDSYDLKMRSLRMDQAQRMEANLAQLAKLPFEIHTGSEWTPARIRAMQIARKYDVVMIDHLHRFPTNPKLGETASISFAANACKNLTHEGCAVILLSQMVKPPERMYSKPNSSMLRGSGMIAAECDASFLLYRNRDDHGNRELSAKLLATDVRDGQGDYAINLEFVPATTSFQEIPA